MLKISFVILVLAFCKTNGQPSDEERKVAHDSLYNNAGAFAGDMMLTGSQKAAIKNRVAINNKNSRWPNGTIPYYIDPSLSALSGMIKQAADQIASKTGNCIKWIPRTNQQKYVRLFYGNGCWSAVGVSGSGAQDLSLGNGCAFIGTVIHEMLHAVGFHHEQNRPDRDNYLNIYWENIQDNMAYNFNKQTDGLTYTDFDFDSIMLYGEKAFTKDWNKSTMLDRTGKHKLLDPYDRKEMTPYDAYEIKRFYDCNW